MLFRGLWHDRINLELQIAMLSTRLRLFQKCKGLSVLGCICGASPPEGIKAVAVWPQLKEELDLLSVQRTMLAFTHESQSSPKFLSFAKRWSFWDMVFEKVTGVRLAGICPCAHLNDSLRCLACLQRIPDEELLRGSELCLACEGEFKKHSTAIGLQLGYPIDHKLEGRDEFSSEQFSNSKKVSPVAEAR